MKIQNVESSLKRGISWNIQNVSGSFFFFFSFYVVSLSRLFLQKKKKATRTNQRGYNVAIPFISLNENCFFTKSAM